MLVVTSLFSAALAQQRRAVMWPSLLRMEARQDGVDLCLYQRVLQQPATVVLFCCQRARLPLVVLVAYTCMSESRWLGLVEPFHCALAKLLALRLMLEGF
jgi:hypothetical protein